MLLKVSATFSLTKLLKTKKTFYKKEIRNTLSFNQTECKYPICLLVFFFKLVSVSNVVLFHAFICYDVGG